MIQQRAAEANKAALEAEKERDELHNQIEQIEEQLHPKRAHTHDAAGDAHEMLPWSWQRSVGWPRSHGKIKGHCRHLAREGSHIDRKDHVTNASSSALVSHLLHEGLEHGAHRYED